MNPYLYAFCAGVAFTAMAIFSLNVLILAILAANSGPALEGE